MYVDAPICAPRRSAAGNALDLTWIPRSTGAGVQTESSAANPHSLGIYEYTLRMTDGSSRLFQETLPASWRVAERLMLIDGQDPTLD